jgi:hypothetical protein
MKSTWRERWLNRWNAYWFPCTTTKHLAVCRIIAVGAQLFWFFPRLEEHLNLLEKNSTFIQPQLLIRAIAGVIPRELLFTPSAFSTFYWLTFALGIAALVGLFTRTALFLFTVGISILIAHLYSYGDRHHNEAIFVFFLLSLAFAPSGEDLSVDGFILRRRAAATTYRGESSRMSDLAMWPLKFAHVLLAMTYFSTGVSKLIAGGLRWMNGYTLQGYTFADALNREIPLGMWLAQHHTAAILLSVFTILFETFFFVSLVVPWTAPLFFLVGIFFHVGLYVTAGHDFFQHMVLNFMLLLFLTPEWWRAWLNRHLGGYLSWWRQPVEVAQVA